MTDTIIMDHTFFSSMLAFFDQLETISNAQKLKSQTLVLNFMLIWSLKSNQEAYRVGIEEYFFKYNKILSYIINCILT